MTPTALLRAALVSFWLGLFAAGCDRNAYVLIVSAEEPGPSIGKVIAPIMRDAIDRQVTIVSQSSLSDTLNRLEAGTAHFAIVENGAPERAGVTTVTTLYTSVLHVLHRSERTPPDLATLLKSGPIYAGAPDGTARHFLEMIAEHLEITQPLDLTDTPWEPEIEVFFVLGGLLSRESQKQLQGRRLYDLDGGADGELSRALSMVYPHVLRSELPQGLYPRLQQGPTRTVGLHSMLSASSHVDADVVYRVAQALTESRSQLAAVTPLAAHVADESTPVLSYPLHEGARRYMSRNEPGFLERYAEVIALTLTVLLMTATSLVGIRNWSKRRRKNRLDEYLARTMEIRTRAHAGTDDLKTMRDELLAVESEVIDLLVNEKIDADEELTTLFTLCENVLRELGEGGRDNAVGRSWAPGQDRLGSIPRP